MCAAAAYETGLRCGGRGECYLIFSMKVRRRARSDGKNRMKPRPKARPEIQRTEARSTFTGGDWSGS